MINLEFNITSATCIETKVYNSISLLKMYRYRGVSGRGDDQLSKINAKSPPPSIMSSQHGIQSRYLANFNIPVEYRSDKLLFTVAHDSNHKYIVLLSRQAITAVFTAISDRNSLTD